MFLKILKYYTLLSRYFKSFYNAFALTLQLTEETVGYMEKTYSNLGKESELYDFFIFYYGDSQSFDTADELHILQIQK